MLLDSINPVLLSFKEDGDGGGDGTGDDGGSVNGGVGDGIRSGNSGEDSITLKVLSKLFPVGA